MHELKSVIRLYLAGFARRRWSILAMAWAACLAGWVAVAALPDRFTAQARIFVDTGTILAPLMKGLAVTTDVEAQVEMMRRTLLSRPNLEQLLRLTDLDKTVQDEAARTALIERLSKQIRLTTEGPGLFRVTYESVDRQQAYAVVDASLQIFVEQNVGNSQRDVDAARAFIDGQIAEYEAKLSVAERRVAQFRREHAEELIGAERGQRQLENAEAAVRQARSELEATTWRRNQLKVELASTPPTLTETEAALATGAGPAETRARDLQSRLDALTMIYTDQHPDIIALRGMIVQARADAAAERAGMRGGPGARRFPNPVHAILESEARSVDLATEDLRRRLVLLEAEEGRLARTATAAPEVEADLVRLTRDHDVINKQYQELVQRREAAQLAKRLDSDTKSVDFRIVDPPLVPVKPSGPPRGMLMLGVLAVGLGAGFGLAFLRIQLAGTFMSVQQLKSAFELPVLGSIALVRSPTRRGLSVIGGAGAAVAGLALVAATGGLFYAYELSPNPPDLRASAASLRGSVSELRARISAQLETVRDGA